VWVEHAQWIEVMLAGTAACDVSCFIQHPATAERAVASTCSRLQHREHSSLQLHQDMSGQLQHDMSSSP
jgi:hypothetical protein